MSVITASALIAPARNWSFLQTMSFVKLLVTMITSSAMAAIPLIVKYLLQMDMPVQHWRNHLMSGHTRKCAVPSAECRNAHHLSEIAVLTLEQLGHGKEAFRGLPLVNGLALQ